MKGILVVVGNGCKPCENMKAELKPLIDSGEVEVVDFETNPKRVEELMNQHHIDLPGLLIVGSNGQVVASS
jgi:hypothetical protein